MSGAGTGLTNPGDIPDDLAPGTYCCRLDESSTMRELRIRFVMPPRTHIPGDCLVQIVKHETEATLSAETPITIEDAVQEWQS